MRLREAAAEAFVQSGLAGASLNGILKRAEMGKSSFYHHFLDKAALHDWVTDGLASALLAEIHPPRLQTLNIVSFRPELSELLDRLARAATMRPELMDLGRMVHNAAEVDAERSIVRVRGAVLAWVTDALHAGQALDVIRQDLPLDLLTAWTTASLIAIDQWMLSTTTPTAPRRVAAETALESLWQLLTGEAQ